MKIPKARRINIHPYFGTSLRNWIELLLQNRGVDLRYMHLAVLITIVTVFLLPFRIAVFLLFNSKIKKVRIKFPPIFIIGHWRSGTTLLHNLMSNDDQFGYVCTYDAFFPYFAPWIRKKGGLLNRILKRLVIMRPHDNIEWSVDSPEEEEFAVAMSSTYSFFHGWIFRNNFEDYFDKYILFRGVSEKVQLCWKQCYHRLLQCATLCNDGKQLILKNPYNTARIRQLLSLYPTAKFIHIYRNPYSVYCSTDYMFKKTSYISLGDVDQNKLNDLIFVSYKKMMAEFNEQVEMIPDGNFVEIKYEDLVADPLKQLEGIYRDLNLEGFHSGKDKFKHYLSSISGYKKNIFKLDGETAQTIYKHWKSFIDKWGYDVPEELIN